MKRHGGSLLPVAAALLALAAAAPAPAHHGGETEALVRSAEQGDAKAQYQLAVLQGSGFGDVEQDAAAALTWHRRSAEQGYAAAQAALGTAYALGHGVEQDYVQAARWCRRSAEQGDDEGQLCLALLYARGAGVERDGAASVQWLRAAGVGGNGIAQALLGDRYATGAGGVSRDPDEADRWYRLATRADLEVTVIAGTEITSGREVLFHLRALATMYRDGIGLPRDDVAAYKWLDIWNRWTPGSPWFTPTPDGDVPIQEDIDRLAEGMTAAQVAEAKLAADTFLATYRDPSAGDGASVPWFGTRPRAPASLLRAAEHGDTMAQARLGDLYAAGGSGLVADAAEAGRWYRVAVREDHSMLLMLGLSYRDGTHGIPRDDAAAYKWLDIVERWDRDSSWTIEDVPLRLLISRLAERMTSEQVAEAKRAADAFLEAYRPS